MKPLHIAACLRIVGKHLRIPKPSIVVVRERIQRLARSRVTQEDMALAIELEAATRMSIAGLAKLTEEWLPRG
jgi:hypothetical protein